MGGTLIDTYPEVDRALADAVWPDGVTPEDLAEVRTLRIRSIEHAITTLAERHGVDRTRLDAAYSALKQRWRTRPAPLMDGALEVMDAVRAAGRRNVVATHRDRASAETLLQALGIEVDDLVCTSDGFARKPDPAMYVELMRRDDIAPSEAIAVGDRVIDVRAAAACGIEGVLLVEDASAVPDLDGLHPRVITSLRELLPGSADA